MSKKQTLKNKIETKTYSLLYFCQKNKTSKNKQVSLISRYSLLVTKYLNMKKLVCSQRYGTTIVRYQTQQNPPPTELQNLHRERFKVATQLAINDMLDPIARAKWAVEVQQSNGKWKTARGAAFAYYYKLMRSEEFLR